jgi:uncharacterized membrane protein
MKKIGLYVMAAFYLFAGLNHFRSPESYQPMMPPYIPFPDLMIALSGGAEIILGIGLFFEPSRKLAAWGVIALLLAIFPVHFYMYAERDTLFAWVPLWLIIARIPMQFVLMYWAYIYTRATARV